METLNSTPSKLFLILLFLLSWFALILQFVLHMDSGNASQGELLIRFFSFFTVDSNLLIAIASTSLLLLPNTKIGRFFARPGTLTALSIYIFVVSLVYNTILRDIWLFEGWGKVANELLHVIVPVLYLIFWIFQVNKRNLQYSSLSSWLIYPITYTAFVFVRGYYSNFYPYPFMNVAKFGVRQVIFNCGIITLIFVVLSFIFIALGRRKTSVKS